MRSPTWRRVCAAMRHARRSASISLADLISTELMTARRQSGAFFGWGQLWTTDWRSSCGLLAGNFAERVGVANGRQHLGVVWGQVEPDLDLVGAGEPSEEADEGATDEPGVEILDDAESGRVGANQDL